MVAVDGALDGVTFPPPNWPKNKRGLPTIDVFLEHKALEARWREGDAVIPDLRMFMVPADLDRGQACSKYAKEACVRAWTRGELCIGDQIRTEASDAEHRTRPSTLLGDEARPRPTYTCATVNPGTGCFGILSKPFERFLDHAATSGQALEFATKIQMQYQSKDSLRWPKIDSGVDVHDLEVDSPEFEFAGADFI